MILRDHGRAVEADLRRFYGVRLVDLYAGRLSAREVRVLVDHLPEDSATVASMRAKAWRDGTRPKDAEPDPGSWQVQRSWTSHRHALADLWDVSAALLAQVQALAGGKGKKFKPYPRPGATAPNRVSLMEASRMIAEGRPPGG